jgi:hypothetical protein
MIRMNTTNNNEITSEWNDEYEFQFPMEHCHRHRHHQHHHTSRDHTEICSVNIDKLLWLITHRYHPYPDPEECEELYNDNCYKFLGCSEFDFLTG